MSQQDINTIVHVSPAGQGVAESPAPAPEGRDLENHISGMPRRPTTALLAIGLVAVVFAVLPYRIFELDRYFVPKELVLHVVALFVAVLMVVRARHATADLADLLLAAFLVWSTLSAVFATSHWLAQRALGVNVSGAILFWAARWVGAGWHRPILIGAAVATVCAAITGLAQAYGMEIDYFSQNRAPGGTFGNRNFVAHFVAIGLPALIYGTATARNSVGALLGTMGVGAVAALLVLTRTRAAWLAVATSFVVLAVALFASRKYWRARPIGGRLARMALTAAVAVAVAIAMPNRLNWRSDSPYLDTALGIADYESGSGRGRVAQYINSMRIAVSNPAFGSGPGNWPVEYVAFAPEGDKSLADDGMTDNPWPSSDWVAYVSERGVIAAVALLGTFVVLFLGAFRRWAELGDTDVVLAKVVLAGTITATVVVSAFDAVLMLAAPAFLAWTIIGAASGAGRAPAEASPPRKWWKPAAVVLLLITLASVARSATQTVAILTVGAGDGWVSAAAWDPGSYRIALRAAEIQANRGRCAAARSHARRARDQFPRASAPRRVLDRCG